MGQHLSSAIAPASSLHKVSPSGFFLFLTPAKHWKESPQSKREVVSNPLQLMGLSHFWAGILEISIKQIFTNLGKPTESPISSIHPKNKTCKTHSTGLTLKVWALGVLSSNGPNLTLGPLHGGKRVRSKTVENYVKLHHSLGVNYGGSMRILDFLCAVNPFFQSTKGYFTGVTFGALVTGPA